MKVLYIQINAANSGNDGGPSVRVSENTSYWIKQDYHLHDFWQLSTSEVVGPYLGCEGFRGTTGKGTQFGGQWYIKDGTPTAAYTTNGYDTMTKIITIPQNINRMRFNWGLKGAEGSIYYRDFRIAPQGIDTYLPQDGTYDLKVTGKMTWTSDWVTVTGGKKYTFKASSQSESTAKPLVNIMFMDAEGNVLLSKTVEAYSKQSWVESAGEETAPENAAYATVELANGSFTYYDSETLIPKSWSQPAKTISIANGSFDASLSGWKLNYTTYTSADTSAVMEWDNNEDHSNNRGGSARIVNADRAQGSMQISQNADIIGGNTYRVSVWVKTENVSSDSNIYAALIFYDENGSTIEENKQLLRFYPIGDSMGVNTSDRTKLSGDIYVNPKAVKLRIDMRYRGGQNNSNGIVWFDDLEIVKLGGIDIQETYNGKPSLSLTGYGDEENDVTRAYGEKWDSAAIAGIVPGQTYEYSVKLKSFNASKGGYITVTINKSSSAVSGGSGSGSGGGGGGGGATALPSTPMGGLKPSTGTKDTDTANDTKKEDVNGDPIIPQPDPTYFTQGIEKIGGFSDIGNAHYADSLVDAVYLYKNFDAIEEAYKSRGIADYKFKSHDDSVTSYAWADEVARNVFIKDNGKRIHLALNWRNPMHTVAVYNTDTTENAQRIRVNNLMRVHAINDKFDSYGYADMYTDRYSMTDWTYICRDGENSVLQAFMCGTYDDYTVLMNSYNGYDSGMVKNVSWTEFEDRAGLDREYTYKDLIDGRLYSFDGEKWQSGGEEMVSLSQTTMVLKKLEFSASRPENGETTFINNTGENKRVSIYSAVYDDNGVLTDAKVKNVDIGDGTTRVPFEMPSGSNTRVFMWETNMKPIKIKIQTWFLGRS